jgi:hypothetical protein
MGPPTFRRLRVEPDRADNQVMDRRLRQIRPLDDRDQAAATDSRLEGVDTLHVPPEAPFYWEVSLEECARLRRDGSILEDEGYLAHDLVWGRLLVESTLDYIPLRDVDPGCDVPRPREHFSDPIAAILQAAVVAGFDPQEVCAAALATRRGVERHAADAVHRSARQRVGVRCE